MRLQRTFSPSGGHGVRAHPDKKDPFFDAWLEQGVSYLGINGRGIRYVVSRGDIYYNLDDAYKKICFYGSGTLKEIHKFCFGISEGQTKDLMKMFPQSSIHTKKQ